MKINLRLIVAATTLLCSLQGNAQQWNFATKFGGNSTGFPDIIKALCTDASGNVYATGNFNGTINFGGLSTPLMATPVGTATDGFVAKFNATGTCQWSVRFGGAASDQGGLGIVTNGTTVYITGSSQFPATVAGVGPFPSVGGSTDGVVFALNASNGAFTWFKAFGGGITVDAGQSICLDNSGNVYISGVFSTRTSNPTASFGAAGFLNRTVQGSMSQSTSDMFVARLDPVNGNFIWVSSGGAASQETPSLVIGNDNVSGSGIVFVPTTNQLVVTGSFANADASYFSNGSASPAFTLTNSGQADMSIIRLDLNGNFIGGLSAGGTTPDEALAATYDASSDAVYLTGYFNSASVTGALSLTNSAAGFDEIFYARYNPSANTIAWAKNATGSAGGNDFGFAINSDGWGNIYATGRYQGTISFPTGTTPLTASSSGADDVFLVKMEAATGNAIVFARGNGATGTDLGTSVAISINNNVWVGGLFAGTIMNFIPSSPAVSVTAGTDQEIFLARFNNLSPVITSQPSASTACLSGSSQFSVVATGAIFYQWQESLNAGFSSPVNLTNAGIYSDVTANTMTISNNTTVNGRYYRVAITNAGGTVFSNIVQLAATQPIVPFTNVNSTQNVNANNNNFFGFSCQQIARIVPMGASPVTGNVTAITWIEFTVPFHASQPFVQQHFELMPAANAATATARVTLYCHQGHFNQFNARPEAIKKLPTNPSDIGGIANLRIGKYSGVSFNGSGLPYSYTSTKTVINPNDADIVFNATANRWEITFDVTGFSGFIIQTAEFPLPVNLISFSAQLSGDDVLLNWKTDGEINHDHFELERSADGRTFSTVAYFLTDVGNGIKNYDYKDVKAASLYASRIYYRLKIVAASGEVEYSNIVIANFNTITTNIITAAVNPFNDHLKVLLNMPAAGKLAIKISDLSGRIVMQENVLAPKGNSTQVIEGTGKLSAGIYIMTTRFGEQVYTLKIIKQP